MEFFEKTNPMGESSNRLFPMAKNGTYCQWFKFTKKQIKKNHKPIDFRNKIVVSL
jgi:hypothetical protein